MDFEALKARVDFSEVDKAKDSFKGLADEIPGAGSALESFESIVKALENPLLAVATALAIATTGAVTLGFKAIEAADNMNDMAERTGKSVEYLQALGDVASKSGSDLDALIDALDGVRKKSLAGDADGKKVAEAYQYLGVSARDASGHLKDAATLAEEGANALDRMGHSADATAAFQTAFGAGALKLTPTLKNLNAEIDKQYDFLSSVGALMDSNLTKAADEYNDTLADLGSVFKGLGNDIARIMLPMLTGMAEAMVNSAKNSGFLSTAFDVLKGTVFVVVGALKGMLTALVALDNGFANVVQSIALGGKVIWAALTGNWDEIPKLWDSYKTRIVQTNVDAANTINKIWSTVDANPQSKEDFKKGKTGEDSNKPFKVPEKAKDERPAKEFDFAAALSKENQEVIKLTAQYKALFGVHEATHTQMLQAKIDAGEYGAKKDASGKITVKAATDEQLAILLTKAARQDAIEVDIRATKVQNDLWKEAEKSIKSEQDRVTALRESNATSNIGRDILAQYGKTQDDVNIAITDYNIAQTQTALAIANASGATEQEVAVLKEKLNALNDLKGVQQDQKDNNKGFEDSQKTFSSGWTKAFNDYRKQAEDNSKMAGDMFNSVTGKMGDALGNFVTTGKLNFKSLAASILADLAKIAMQKAIVNIASSMFADGGAFSGGVQFFATGDVFDSPTAFGMSGGKTGVMGEAGPEAIMPLTRGQDGKLGVVASGAGGGSTTNQYSVSINIQSVDSPERVQELQRAMESSMIAVAKKTMADQLRTGGMLNRAR
ncbi:phage tail tape measure C-terminal domain-containing protein [Aquabacterium sp.]|uniref:phage tail tape measure C-terminal domain-containing protein n=1 Tax=Aquabacterium sp. TaxID=1872578 RepID=UPI003D6CE901